MSKRDKERITLGSGKLFIMEFTGQLPKLEEICQRNNILGWIKGGASLEYTSETYEEKDDLGMVTKIITTSEEAILKAGILTWNGNTLSTLTDTGRTYIEDGKRVTKIGGLENAKNKSYVICFYHHDRKDGDIWVMIVGRNQAGLTLTWATDSGSLLEPEFKALPHDEEGTLIEFVEELEITGYMPTTDTEIDENKTYYTRSGSEGAYTYTKVTNPNKSGLSTYYEPTYE